MIQLIEYCYSLQLIHRRWLRCSTVAFRLCMNTKVPSITNRRGCVCFGSGRSTATCPHSWQWFTVIIMRCQRFQGGRACWSVVMLSPACTVQAGGIRAQCSTSSHPDDIRSPGYKTHPSQCPQRVPCRSGSAFVESASASGLDSCTQIRISKSARRGTISLHHPMTSMAWRSSSTLIKPSFSLSKELKVSSSLALAAPDSGRGPCLSGSSIGMSEPYLIQPSAQTSYSSQSVSHLRKIHSTCTKLYSVSGNMSLRNCNIACLLVLWAAVSWWEQACLQ